MQESFKQDIANFFGGAIGGLHGISTSAVVGGLDPHPRYASIFNDGFLSLLFFVVSEIFS